MKAGLSEGRFLIYSVSAIFLLMAIHIFQPQLNTLYNPRNYTGIHTLLETFSISISMTIFFYGLKNYIKNKSGRFLLLSFTFLLASMLDTFHMLTFKGMPYLFTESSAAKATWFWVISRTINSLLILLILLIPNRKLKRDVRWLIILAGGLAAVLIGIFVFQFEQKLPLLVIEGQGTTLLKTGIDYFICGIEFITLVITLFQYDLEKDAAKLAIALAMVFLLLSELVLTVYKSVYDLDNFSGHIFKVMGFYFILKGFYFAVSNQGQEKQAEPERKRLISQIPGFIFMAVKKEDEFICVYCNGELLRSLSLHREDCQGRPLAKIFPHGQVPFMEYCQLSGELHQTKAFEMEYLGQSLLVSIKPAVDDEGNESILGTVIDMTEVRRKPPIHPLEENNRKNIKIVM